MFAFSSLSFLHLFPIFDGRLHGFHLRIRCQGNKVPRIWQPECVLAAPSPLALALTATTSPQTLSWNHPLLPLGVETSCSGSQTVLLFFLILLFFHTSFCGGEVCLLGINHQIEETWLPDMFLCCVFLISPAVLSQSHAAKNKHIFLLLSPFHSTWTVLRRWESRESYLGFWKHWIVFQINIRFESFISKFRQESRILVQTESSKQPYECLRKKSWRTHCCWLNLSWTAIFEWTAMVMLSNPFLNVYEKNKNHQK